MNNSYDVIIVGGGVNGCSSAYQLAKRGYRTLVLERGRVAGEASSAAAGMLGAQVEISEKGPFFDFARTSRDMFRDLVPELEERAGMSVSYVQNGMLKVACSEVEKTRLRSMLSFQKQTDEQVEWWGREELSCREPALSDQAAGALFIPRDSQVKAEELTLAYARAAASYGADIKEFTQVTSLLQQSGRVYGATTTEGDVYAAHVILAAGAWTDMIPEAADLKMVPVKGEILSVRPAVPLITSTIHAADFYLVPKAGGSLIIGATEHEGVKDKKVTAASVQHLLTKAIALVPQVAEAEFERAWTGVRPQSADEKPYLGAAHLEGLWVAAGHYRNGILLSALTGKWIADLIGGNPVDPDWEKEFSPLRMTDRKENGVEINH
ncbi:glycine oxidase ThiO [Bacillus piscicola]|uniref:glycine oxidase ThiO n=1 Tax=Bacillus piscicola TaxID=1632684 RepID=UPI001F08B054|nr:glycine oxidase ThiO [Bacillus piscicola]